MTVRKPTLCVVVPLIYVVLLVVKRVDIYVCQTNVFKSNVTNQIYSVISPNTHMDCGTDNIIYLVSCKQCGVGETGQTLRKRLNRYVDFIYTTILIQMDIQ